MGIAEFLSEREKINEAMNTLHISRDELDKEYLREHAEFENGEKIIVRTKEHIDSSGHNPQVDEFAFVHHISINFLDGKVRYHLKKCTTKNKQSHYAFRYGFMDELIKIEK